MSNETKQTVVEQFAIALYECGYLRGNGDEIEKLLNTFQAMEKQQVEEAELRGKEIIIIKHKEHEGGNK
jgi:predicted transcriptional regulator